MVRKGSIVLSNGREIRIEVVLTCPGRLTRAEARELANARPALHDLTPIEG
jgi:hypothetical protein